MPDTTPSRTMDPPERTKLLAWMYENTRSCVLAMALRLASGSSSVAKPEPASNSPQSRPAGNISCIIMLACLSDASANVESNRCSWRGPPSLHERLKSGWLPEAKGSTPGAA